MRTSTPVRVLCVDDNRLVADAIMAKLRMEGGFEWVGHLTSADDLLQKVLHKRPDIVLLDLDMPGTDPIVAAQSVSDSGSSARLIVLSGYVNPELFRRVIRAGVWGYISKSDGELALIEGIRAVAAGGFVMSPEVEAVCERPSSEQDVEESLLIHTLPPPACRLQASDASAESGSVV